MQIHIPSKFTASFCSSQPHEPVRGPVLMILLMLMIMCGWV